MLATLISEDPNIFIYTCILISVLQMQSNKDILGKSSHRQGYSKTILGSTLLHVPLIATQPPSGLRQPFINVM